MTLIEVMVGLFLVALGALAVVPMFAYATHNNATGRDQGIMGGMAVEWMEENNPEDEELLRFRREAAELLGIAEEAESERPLGTGEADKAIKKKSSVRVKEDGNAGEGDPPDS